MSRTISVVIDVELLERVDARAESEKRTRSNLINKLIKEGLK